jgi:hypothetical protein
MLISVARNYLNEMLVDLFYARSSPSQFHQEHELVIMDHPGIDQHRAGMTCAVDLTPSVDAP